MVKMYKNSYESIHQPSNGLKFNRQPSKALKFNRQLSKLERITVNRQSYHPIETLTDGGDEGGGGLVTGPSYVAGLF